MTLARLRLSLAAPALAAVCALFAGEDADFRRAHHLYTLQEYKLAAEALDKYLADFPASERAGQAQLLLAESLYQLKDLPGAVRHFEAFLAANADSPRRADALQRAVKLQYLCKNYAPSVKWADVFLKENRERLGKPDLPALPALFESVLHYAAESSLALQKPEQAKAYWETLRKDFPQAKLLPDATEGLGWIAFEAGRFEEALPLLAFAAAAPRYPNAAASQVLRARCLAKLGKTDEALAALEAAASLGGGPEQARAVAYWRASFLFEAKRYEPALAAFRELVKAHAAHAETPPAVSQAATRLQDEGRHAESLALADLYLASFPQGADRPALARVRARSLAALNRPAEALAGAQAALKEAEALTDAARRTQAERPAALTLLAELSGAEGRALYETVVRDHPGTRYARVARYQLARLAREAGKTEEALALAEELLKELPAGNAETADLRRMTLFAAADFAFWREGRKGAEAFLNEYAGRADVQAEPEKYQLSLIRLRQAWCRYEAGEAAAARALLDQGLSLPAPGDLKDEMRYLRGLAGLGGRDAAPEPARLEGALGDFKALAAASPNSSFAAYACVEAARALVQAKRSAEALGWLDKVLENPAHASSPLRAEALLLRARTRYASARQADALGDLEALLKLPSLEPKEQAPAARLLRGLCLEALPGREAEAERAYGELFAAGPADQPLVRQGLLRRAQLRFNAGRFEEAKGDYAVYLAQPGLLESDAAAQEAAVRLALCLKELKDLAGARARLEKLAQGALAGGLAFEVPFQLGNLAYDAAQHAEAAAHYRKALDAARGFPDLPKPALCAALLNLAWSQKLQDDGKAAEGTFAELLKLDPDGPYSAEARYQRGRLLAEAGNPAAAQALWKELLEKQPVSPLAEKALAALGDAQAKAGGFAEAAKTFEAYLAKYPDGSAAREAWCGLAECRLQTRDPKGAREAFLKALGPKGLESDLDATGERALLGLAELAQTQGDSTEAKKLALRVLIDRPESKWLDAALYLCATASESLAEPNQAIGYYRKLLAERPKSERAATARERLKALGAPASD